MLPALEAILGQRSAHSLATGPVMAEPADTDKESRVSLLPPLHALLENKGKMKQQTAINSLNFPRD